MHFEPNNNHLLDDSFSNFRFLGIGKPSKKQVAHWANAERIAKIAKMVDKGLIDINSLDPKTRYAVESLMSGGEVVEQQPTKAPLPKLSALRSKLVKKTAASKEADISKDESTSRKAEETPTEKKYLGMSKKTGLILVAVLIFGAAGFVYYKMKIAKN
jgi:hypothetical protein